MPTGGRSWSGAASVAENRIVITHGTDTMEQTAAVLGRELTGKTIVLTGAMVPYTFGSSDGLFNLGTAMAFVQTLGAGVYVAMNGRCFPWHSVRKNKKRGSSNRCRSEPIQLAKQIILACPLSSILKVMFLSRYVKILSLSREVC